MSGLDRGRRIIHRKGAKEAKRKAFSPQRHGEHREDNIFIKPGDAGFIKDSGLRRGSQSAERLAQSVKRVQGVGVRVVASIFPLPSSLSLLFISRPLR